MRAWVPVLLGGVLSGAIAGAARAEDRVLRLGERTPIAVVIGTPTGETAQVRSSEVIRAISDQLRAHTDLDIELMEPAALAECKGRLLCLIERAGGGRHASNTAPPFLLVLANVSREGEPDRLSAQLVDVNRATDTMARGRRPGEDWGAEVEATLNEDAIATERVTIARPDDAERAIADWVEHRFAPTFEAAGHWEPYGEIVIEAAGEGLEVSIDGQAIGATGAAETRVMEVRAGARQLVLVGPTIERYTTTIEVVRGETVRLSPDLSSVGLTGVRPVVMVSGGVLALAGAVTSVIGLAMADGSVTTYCFDGPGCESGSAFPTSGFDSGNASALLPVNGPGIYVLPLGLGLLGAGASWTLGAWLQRDEAVPWIPLVVGTGIGVLTYVLGATLSTRPESAP